MKRACSQIWASYSKVQLRAVRLVSRQLAKTVLPRFAVMHWLIVAPQFAEVMQQNHSKNQICCLNLREYSHYVNLYDCLMLPSA